MLTYFSFENCFEINNLKKAEFISLLYFNL